MAAKKTFVYVDKFTVTKIFDSKYKNKARDLMHKLTTKWLEKSKLLTTKGNKRQEGFMLRGSLKLLKGDKRGKTLLAAEVSLIMATWPKRSAFGFAPNSKASVEVLNEKKIERDVEDLLEALFESLIRKQAVKELEKRAKALAKAG